MWLNAHSINYKSVETNDDIEEQGKLLPKPVIGM
jgi:hypothetical protein